MMPILPRNKRHKAYEDEWDYWPAEQPTIEVWDHEEGETREDTGLLDQYGNPLMRIVRYVRNPIGFVWDWNDHERAK